MAEAISDRPVDPGMMPHKNTEDKPEPRGAKERSVAAEFVAM